MLMRGSFIVQSAAPLGWIEGHLHSTVPNHSFWAAVGVDAAAILQAPHPYYPRRRHHSQATEAEVVSLLRRRSLQ